MHFVSIKSSILFICLFFSISSIALSSVTKLVGVNVSTFTFFTLSSFQIGDGDEENYFPLSTSGIFGWLGRIKLTKEQSSFSV